jgi:hypothetical protein
MRYRKTRHKAEHVAPFALWPSSFDFHGKCKRCKEFKWLAPLVVPVRLGEQRTYHEHSYCEECMILLGVGTDVLVGD